jgi:4-hydroxybenzoate polyprenyltransferase
MTQGDAFPTDSAEDRAPGVLDVIRLLRPAQWAKSAFLLIGPAYGLADGAWDPRAAWPTLVLVIIAFSLASSACYIINDVLDAPTDRNHPRKRNRPIASGRISPGFGIGFAAGLVLVCAAALWFVPRGVEIWTLLCVAIYVVNVTAYSAILKHIVIADVICLSIGFVVRVLAGCAAVGVTPSTWLLNSTFFLAMFLAFGKRLGERRLLGGTGATAARGVQAGYTDELLRLAVMVTAVVTLMTYANYVQSRDAAYTRGFNLLWLTMLPATYSMLRAIVTLERGTYDDPTQLAFNDWPFQLGALAFVLLTVALMAARHWQWIGTGALPAP